MSIGIELNKILNRYGIRKKLFFMITFFTSILLFLIPYTSFTTNTNLNQLRDEVIKLTDLRVKFEHIMSEIYLQDNIIKTVFMRGSEQSSFNSYFLEYRHLTDHLLHEMENFKGAKSFGSLQDLYLKFLSDYKILIEAYERSLSIYNETKDIEIASNELMISPIQMGNLKSRGKTLLVEIDQMTRVMLSENESTSKTYIFSQIATLILIIIVYQLLLMWGINKHIRRIVYFSKFLKGKKDKDHDEIFFDDPIGVSNDEISYLITSFNETAAKILSKKRNSDENLSVNRFNLGNEKINSEQNKRRIQELRNLIEKLKDSFVGISSLSTVEDVIINFLPNMIESFGDCSMGLIIENGNTILDEWNGTDFEEEHKKYFREKYKELIDLESDIVYNKLSKIFDYVDPLHLFPLKSDLDGQVIGMFLYYGERPRGKDDEILTIYLNSIIISYLLVNNRISNKKLTKIVNLLKEKILKESKMWS